MHDLLFTAAAGTAVGAALLAVTRRNPIYSALWLLIAFVAFALIFLDLAAPFLAAMHVLVYTGAILVLFLFVIMLLNLKPEELAFDAPGPRWGVLAAGCTAFGAGLAFLLVRGLQAPELAPLKDAGFGGGAAVGNAIFSGGTWVLPFEMVSVLIIAAMIGAVILARPSRDSGGPG